MSTLVDTIATGMNNPDCSFFVGQMIGTLSAGSLIVRVAIIYFGFKVLDKIVFTGIPYLYKNIGKR